MNTIVSSVAVLCLLVAMSDGRLVRRQVPPVIPRPVVPPVVPRPIVPPVAARIPGAVVPGINPLNDVPIISYINENNFDGSYKYSYETGNGISVQEEGVLVNPGQPELEAQTARGAYSYTAPDGQLIQVTWYADETGFHAEGAHIPKIGQYAGVVPPAVVAGRGVVRPAPVLPAPVLPAPGIPAPVAGIPAPISPVGPAFGRK